MKMKNKLKTTLMILAIVVLCLSVGAYAGYVMSAADVSYTKPDGTTVSVKVALDELHAKEQISFMEKAVGDEVTIGGEQFYVLECDKYSRVATLISKYNLNKAGTAQQNAVCTLTACAFSSTNYWRSETSYPLNLNDYYGYSSTDALAKAKNYGTSKGAVESRLLTYEEADALQTKASLDTKIATMLWGKANTDGYLKYWLGSAVNNNYVYSMTGVGSSNMSSDIFSDTWYTGVRPVITVFKSSIS